MLIVLQRFSLNGGFFSSKQPLKSLDLDLVSISAFGQKRSLKPKEIWSIRIRLQMNEHRRDLALFSLALASKLRGCDLLKLKVRDVCHSDRVLERATVLQQKT